MNIDEAEPKKKLSEQQVFKAVRLPRAVVQQIERLSKRDGSTFSQFMRTAAMRELRSRRMKRSAA